jgi:hypothetical protein
MSQATHDLLTMWSLLQDFSKATKLIFGNTITHSTIFINDKGCVQLASAPKLHPHTKHIGLKYHHFHSHVASGAIKIHGIDTTHQIADIFTKPLPASTLEYLRA